jgi:fucose 4-O-acetylase-like acetyltransferase
MLMKSLKRTKQIIVPLVAFTLFYILGILETKIPNLSNGDWYATTIPLSISMFMFFTNIQQSKDNILSKTGREDSFYIYIFHFLFAIIFSKIYEKTNAWYLPYCSTLIVFIATMLFIYILRKTKIIGKFI